MGSRGIVASSRPDIRNPPTMSIREFENHMIRERRIEKLAGRNHQCLVDSFLPIVPRLVGQVMDMTRDKVVGPILARTWKVRLLCLWRGGP